jgi:hypothetical protein
MSGSYLKRFVQAMLNSVNPDFGHTSDWLKFVIFMKRLQKHKKQQQC